MTDKPTLFYVASSLPRQFCTADSPMPEADKDRFQWGHPDAIFIEPLFNLGIYRCPHCNLKFHAPRRIEAAT